jgi:YbbR-like protein.
MSRSRKFVTMLVSLLGAILLWLYVVSSVAPETTSRISAIPINIDGSIVLEERNLIITGRSAETLSLELSTSRVNLSKLNADSIRINADASKIREPGEYALTCTVTFPDTVRSSEVDILRKSTDTVTITVSKLEKRSIPIEFPWTGAVQEGYFFESNSVVLDPEELVVEGPDYEVEQIAKAVVTYDVSDLKQTELVTVPVTFLDEAGEELELSEYTTVNASNVNLTLPVLSTRKLELGVRLLAGGGVKEENAKVTIEPEAIQVKGSREAIEALEDVMILGDVDLSAISDHLEHTYNLVLPTGVSSISGETTATVKITITGVSSSNISISDIRLINIPEGFEAQALTGTVKVRVRGSTEEIRELQQARNNGLYIVVDLSEEDRLGAFTVTGNIVNEEHPAVSVADTVEISINMSANAPEPTPED